MVQQSIGWNQETQDQGPPGFGQIGVVLMLRNMALKAQKGKLLPATELLKLQSFFSKNPIARITYKQVTMEILVKGKTASVLMTLRGFKPEPIEVGKALTLEQLSLILEFIKSVPVRGVRII